MGAPGVPPVAKDSNVRGYGARLALPEGQKKDLGRDEYFSYRQFTALTGLDLSSQAAKWHFTDEPEG
jgi:hypothetical protein